MSKLHKDQPDPITINEVKVEETKMNETLFHNNIFGIFETVTSAPTGKPTKLINQIKIYTNGSTYRLYWYDALNDTWHYITATA